MSISKNYDIGSKVLGTGGFGSVTLGKDIVSGSPVAVKTVSKKHFDQAEVHMLRELNTVHTIRYRHDFEVLDPAKPEDDKHVIVMDLVAGRDILATYYAKTTGEKLSLAEIRTIAYQLFEFLAELEEKNVAYIDLKPENMIYQKSCRNLTVVDLGTAYQIGTEYGRKTGASPYYAAPDYLLGKPFTTGFDLWSAGCTFYSMVCSKYLFEVKPDSNAREKFEQVLQQIVEQIGPPSANYLKDGKKSHECFDQDLKLKKTWPSETPFVHWQENFLTGLEQLGATAEEKTQWLDLMKMLLSYENRGSAKAHLDRPLFQSEMKVHLEYDPKCRCKMYMQRLELLEKHIDLTPLSDIKEFDYKANFRIDKSCCIHLPESATGKYAIFLELNNRVVSGTVTLQKGNTLNIRNLQENLVTPVQVEIVDEGEPDQKKTKTEAE